jgi:hypothetical protein
MNFSIETIATYVMLVLITSAIGALPMLRYAPELSFQTRFLLILWVLARVAVMKFLMDAIEDSVVQSSNKDMANFLNSNFRGLNFLLVFFLTSWLIAIDIKKYGIKNDLGRIGVGPRMAGWLLLCNIFAIIPVVLIKGLLLHHH